MQIASLFVRLGADTTQFKQGMRSADSEVRRASRKMQAEARQFRTSMMMHFAAASVAVYSVSRAIQSNIKAFQEQEQAEARLNQVLRSTQKAAGYVAAELKVMAKQLQTLTTYGDEEIISAEALLLTFTKIGRDIFPQALETVLDMSQALGQDLKSSAIQLGKALQDPILGVTALRRVGVNFNEEQTEVIRNLVKTGQAAEAQRMILKELNTEFGGQARAAASTYSGSLKQLGNEYKDLKEILGEQLIPVFADFSEAMIPVIRDVGELVRLYGKLSGILEHWPRGPWDLPGVKHFLAWRDRRQEQAIAKQGWENQAAALSERSGILVTNISSFARALAEIERQDALKKQAEYLEHMAEAARKLNLEIDPIMNRNGSVEYGIFNVKKEWQEVPNLIIVSKEAMREFHEEAALVADIIAYDVVGAFFQMARAGKDAMQIILDMLIRIANQLASMWIWDKIYAWRNPFAGSTTDSSGAIVGGGVSDSMSGWIGGATPSITIIDQRVSGSPDISVTQTPGDIQIFVTDILKDAVTSGTLDDTFRNTFGLSRSVVVR